MTTTGSLQISCGKMLVRSRDPKTGKPWQDENGTPQPKWRKTDELVADVTLRMLTFTKCGKLVFGATWVKPLANKPNWRTRWAVDPCPARGYWEGLVNGFDAITNELPQESVELRAMWKPPFFYLVALSITAPGKLILDDGTVKLFDAVYPDAPSYRVGRGVYEVQPVSLRCDVR